MSAQASITFVPLAGTPPPKAPSRFLLLKDGNCDLEGYEKIHLDAESAGVIIADFATQGNQLPIDYHHASLDADKGKGKAPAAGWIHKLEYVKGEGLYAVDVEWTDDAAMEIASRQFKYVSPVVFANGDGELSMLHSVALTNRPRTRSMTELLQAAQRVAASWEINMATATKDPPDKTDVVKGQDDVEEPISPMTVTPEQEAMVKAKLFLEEKGASLGEGAGVAEIIMALIDQAGGEAEEVEAPPEETEAQKSERAAMEAKAASYDGLAKRLKLVEGQLSERDKKDRNVLVSGLVNDQIEAGKILPDDTKAVEAARRFAASNPEDFQAVYASMTPIVEPGSVIKASDPGPPRNGRAKMILAAAREFDANPQLAFGAPKRAYIDSALSEDDHKPLSDDEAEKHKE